MQSFHDAQHCRLLSLQPVSLLSLPPPDLFHLQQGTLAAYECQLEAMHAAVSELEMEVRKRRAQRARLSMRCTGAVRCAFDFRRQQRMPQRMSQRTR